MASQVHFSNPDGEAGAWDGRVEEGRVVFSLMPGEERYDSLGSVHGGVYATFAARLIRP